MGYPLSMTLRALLIDDDHRLFELLRDYFADHELVIEHAADGPKGLLSLKAGSFDVVLLDVMMPGMDGLEVLKRLRGMSGVPVVMLTARGEETDRVVGLELGADDYVPKPFSPRELLARIRAVLRRGQPRLVDEEIGLGALTVNISTREVRKDGQRIELTGLEFDLLVTLMRRAGRVVPRSAMLQVAGRDEVVGERTVDVHISHLRKKLGAQLIKTVRGVGYVMASD